MPMDPAHQLAEQVGALQDGQPAFLGGAPFGIRLGHGRRDEQQVRALDVGSAVADENANALVGQRGRLAVGLLVGAADPVATAEQHAGDGRHAGSADADDVNVHSGLSSVVVIVIARL